MREISQVMSWVATGASVLAIGVAVLGGPDPVTLGVAEGLGYISMLASFGSWVNGCLGYLFDATCKAQAAPLLVGLAFAGEATPLAGSVYDLLVSGPWYFASRPAPVV